LFADPIVGDVNFLNVLDSVKIAKFHYLVNKILLLLVSPQLRVCSADILSNVTNFLKKAWQKNGRQKNIYGFLVSNCGYFLIKPNTHISVLHFSVFAFE